MEAGDDPNRTCYLATKTPRTNTLAAEALQVVREISAQQPTTMHLTCKRYLVYELRVHHLQLQPQLYTQHGRCCYLRGSLLHAASIATTNCHTLSSPDAVCRIAGLRALAATASHLMHSRRHKFCIQTSTYLAKILKRFVCWTEPAQRNDSFLRPIGHVGVVVNAENKARRCSALDHEYYTSGMKYVLFLTTANEKMNNGPSGALS